MLFSGLESVSYNINRKKNDLKFFEFGKTYKNIEGEYFETKHLSLFITGPKTKESWTMSQERTNFFTLKGYVNKIFEKLGLSNLDFQSVESKSISEGLTGKLNSKKIIDFGRVKTDVLKHFDIEQEVLFADINWSNVLEVLEKKQLKIKEIPKFPSTQRDFALLLDQSVNFDELKELAFMTDKKILKGVDLFDVYEGEKLPEKKKSYALRFKFMDEKKTLTDKQVDKVMKKLQNQFEIKFNASLR